MNAIEIHDLTKTFGRTTALDRLELTVPSGQVRGFLGPNGAGKSTTIRVLLGLLRPDSGTAQLLGGDPYRDAVALHRRLAYVPGDVSLWPSLSGGECIDLLSRARGGVDKARRDALLEEFQLDPRKKAKTYSKGNRQKVALVAALAADVELLILDEPTSGLDPLMERVFTDRIRAFRGEGRTVLLSSHILSEVEQLCDEVSIIKNGRIVESGTLAEMRHLHKVTVSAEVDGGVPEGLERIDGVSGLAVDGDHVQLDVASQALPQVLSLLSAAGVRSLTSAPPSLEELFVRHYEDVA